MVKIDKKLSERISKEDFFDYLNKTRERDKVIETVYQCSDRNLDLINFQDWITKPLRVIERNFFSIAEKDLISWYLYEYKEENMKIYKAGPNKEEVIAEILTDDDLWEYLNRDDMECWNIVYPEPKLSEETKKFFNFLDEGAN